MLPLEDINLCFSETLSAEIYEAVAGSAIGQNITATFSVTLRFQKFVFTFIWLIVYISARQDLQLTEIIFTFMFKNANR